MAHECDSISSSPIGCRDFLTEALACDEVEQSAPHCEYLSASPCRLKLTPCELHDQSVEASPGPVRLGVLRRRRESDMYLTHRLEIDKLSGRLMRGAETMLHGLRCHLGRQAWDMGKHTTEWRLEASCANVLSMSLPVG